MYLKIWDVGGQHSLRRLWQSYYKSCHAIVFVVDSSDVGDGDLGFLERKSKGKINPGLGIAHTRRKSASALATLSPEEVVGDGQDGDLGVGATNGTDASPRVSQEHHSAATTSTVARDHVGRLEECKLVLESVLASEDTVGVPILVLANKQDREDCVETVKIKEGLVRPVFEGEKGGGVRDSRVLPVSALTGQGVPEAVEWIRSRVKWNREGRAPVMR